MTAARPAAGFAITVTPAQGLLSERRSITITGAFPGSLVTVRAETRRGAELWASQVVYLADSNGTVDLDESAPVSGDFRVADAMGLLWAQRRETEFGGSSEPSDVAEDLVTHITASSVEHTGEFPVAETAGAGASNPGAPSAVASARLTQHLLVPGVSRSEVRDEGLVGTLFTPEGDGPHPTIIVMNGSGGGINEARAALYAAAGIQAFALGYFKTHELSPYISRTPLEYFERALRYVARECSPLGGLPIISGQSRGGELSLLLAATFPSLIGGVVAFVPGAFVFGAQGAADPADGWNGPTWLYEGRALEHLWNNNAAVTWQPWNDEPPPTRHTDVYVEGLKNRELARASRIPIENFSGPVMCVSGLDDRAWPSSMASRIVFDALERAGHTAERAHLDYVDAGHGIAIPHLPATEIERVHPVSGVHYSNGGTPRGIAYASADSFTRVCEFVHRTAAAHATSHSKER